MVYVRHVMTDGNFQFYDGLMVVKGVSKVAIYNFAEYRLRGHRFPACLCFSVSLISYQIEEKTMGQAYSQIKRILDKRGITVPGLHRRIAKEGGKVNLKSLYRLSNDHELVERLNLRVTGMICQEGNIG